MQHPLHLITVGDSLPITSCSAIQILISENPLTTRVTSGTNFKRIRMSCCNPIPRVVTFLPQLNQYSGSFLSGMNSIRMPKVYLWKVNLVS